MTATSFFVAGDSESYMQKVFVNSDWSSNLMTYRARVTRNSSNCIALNGVVSFTCEEFLSSLPEHDCFR
jgi:hypothetical protein